MNKVKFSSHIQNIIQLSKYFCQITTKQMPFFKLISRNFQCIEQPFHDISINFSLYFSTSQREVKDEEVENLENRFS